MDDQKRETTYPNLSGAVLPKRGGIELETRKIPSVLSGFLLVSPIFVFMTLSGHVLSPTAHAGSAIHTQAPVVVASKPGRPFATTTVRIPGLAYKQTMRSEERRVGKECRSRLPRRHKKQNHKKHGIHRS